MDEDDVEYLDDDVDMGAGLTEGQLQTMVGGTLPGWTITVQDGDFRTYRLTDGERKFVDTRFQDVLGRAMLVGKGLGELEWDGTTWRIHRVPPQQGQS